LPASAPFTLPAPSFGAALRLEPPWLGRPCPRSLRRWRRLVLAFCGLLSTLAVTAIPTDGPHPLALLAGLLPLQMAGLLWGVARTS
jgi:hypothetical protein